MVTFPSFRQISCCLHKFNCCYMFRQRYWEKNKMWCIEHKIKNCFSSFHRKRCNIHLKSSQEPPPSLFFFSSSIHCLTFALAHCPSFQMPCGIFYRAHFTCVEQYQNQLKVEQGSVIVYMDYVLRSFNCLLTRNRPWDLVVTGTEDDDCSSLPRCKHLEVLQELDQSNNIIFNIVWYLWVDISLNLALFYCMFLSQYTVSYNI